MALQDCEFGAASGPGTVVDVSHTDGIVGAIIVANGTSMPSVTLPTTIPAGCHVVAMALGYATTPSVNTGAGWTQVATADHDPSVSDPGTRLCWQYFPTGGAQAQTPFSSAVTKGLVAAWIVRGLDPTFTPDLHSVTISSPTLGAGTITLTDAAPAAGLYLFMSGQLPPSGDPGVGTHSNVDFAVDDTDHTAGSGGTALHAAYTSTPGAPVTESLIFASGAPMAGIMVGLALGVDSTGSSTSTGTYQDQVSTAGGTAGQIAYFSTATSLAAGDLSGDVTTSGGRVTTLASTAVTPGSYTGANITVDAKGRVTAAANGSGGAGTVTHTAGALTLNQLVFGNGAADIKVGDLTGDVTTSGGTATTIGALKVATGMIQASAVTLAKIANASANSKLVGSGAAGSGSAYTEITVGSGLTMTGTTLSASGGSGTVTTTGSPATGNLAKFSGATSVTSGDLSGDVTTSGTLAATIANDAVTTAKINNSAVTLAKIANASANTRFLGSGSSGSGAAYAEQTISAGTGISIAAASGGITITAVGSGISGASPYTYTNAPFANVSALLHFDGTNGSTTITDVIGGTWTATGTAAISTAQSVYGGASLLVPGSGNSAAKRTTSSAFDVAAGDWAIEFRWRYNGAPQTFARVFATRDGDTNQGIALTIDSGSILSLNMSASGGSADIIASTQLFQMSQSGWSTVIVQRRGAFVECFLNGTLVKIFTIGALSVYYNSGDTIVIGGNSTSTSRSMNAYIDEFRFTKGAYVMVPGDPVLPTSAFPNS